VILRASAMLLGILSQYQVENLAGVQFLAPTYSATSTDGEAILTVVRTGSTLGACSVDFATEDGTAISNGDPLWEYVVSVLPLDRFYYDAKSNSTWVGDGAPELDYGSPYASGGGRAFLTGPVALQSPTPGLHDIAENEPFCFEGSAKMVENSNSFSTILSSDHSSFTVGSTFFGIYGDAVPGGLDRTLAFGMFGATPLVASTVKAPMDAWFRWCLQRDADGLLTLWLDDEIVASIEYGAAIAWGQLRIGSIGWDAIEYLQGAIADVRLTIGVARYVEPVIAPTEYVSKFLPYDYTAVNGTLTWLAGDATPKTIHVPIFAFAHTGDCSAKLDNAIGATLGVDECVISIQNAHDAYAKTIGMVRSWAMRESGSSFADSQHGSSLNASGPILTGYAAYVDRAVGVFDTVSPPTMHANVGLTGSFSIAVVAYGIVGGSGAGGPVAALYYRDPGPPQPDDPDYPGQPYGGSVGVYVTGKPTSFEFFISNPTVLGSPSRSVTANSVPTDGKFSYLIFAVSAGSLKVFHRGVEVASAAISGEGLGRLFDNFYVGPGPEDVHGVSGGGYFAETIRPMVYDQIMLFNRAVTGAEAAILSDLLIPD
jgi:hypothetical protein